MRHMTQFWKMNHHFPGDQGSSEAESLSGRRYKISKSAQVQKKWSTKEGKDVQETEGEKRNSNPVERTMQEPHGFHTYCTNGQMGLKWLLPDSNPRTTGCSWTQSWWSTRSPWGMFYCAFPQICTIFIRASQLRCHERAIIWKRLRSTDQNESQIIKYY